MKISRIPTPSSVLLTRIPFKIEKWIIFFLTHDECKTQSFYQQWFIDVFFDYY